MPKKYHGENSKAVEAKARKEALKTEDELKKKKQLEDEYWKDDDKHVIKKMQRKDEKDKKKVEQLEKKKELQKLADEELEILSKSSIKVAPAPKVTRLQVESHTHNIATTNKETAPKTNVVTVDELPLEENINKMLIEGEVARTVDDAIQILSSEDLEIDNHPEKRMKAAYLAYEEKRLPELKLEYLNLRLSQLKQMLRKDWNKSPENPLNQIIKVAK